VQVGQRIQAGAPLMSIIPLEQVWVEANFKEVQLRQMRIGQPVKLHADIYGSKIEYDGRVVGLGAGTGAAFALLPAQNATGNWIKVVQRVPVRILLDPREVAAHALRIGLSVDVSVQMHPSDGARLDEVVRPTAAATPMPAGDDRAADEAVQRIIGENLAEITPATVRKTGAGPAATFPRSPLDTRMRGDRDGLQTARTAR
jgi:membrane fusion protein (multidrug efflux system)